MKRKQALSSPMWRLILYLFLNPIHCQLRDLPRVLVPCRVFTKQEKCTPVYVKFLEISSFFVSPHVQVLRTSNLNIQTIAHIPRSTALIYKNSYRCVPLVSAVMSICLVSKNPTCTLFDGPKVKCYASCWNQLIVHTNASRYNNSCCLRACTWRKHFPSLPPQFAIRLESSAV